MDRGQLLHTRIGRPSCVQDWITRALPTNGTASEKLLLPRCADFCVLLVSAGEVICGVEQTGQVMQLHGHGEAISQEALQFDSTCMFLRTLTAPRL
jgi:hypothetical protein